VVKKEIVALDQLKTRYLALESQLTATRNEVYWEQGKILLQIKAAVGHGKWLKWVEKNLHIDQQAARRRLAVGSLSSLPKSVSKDRFESTLIDLSAVAVLARKQKLPPDAAAEAWSKKQFEEFGRRVREEPARSSPSASHDAAMSRTEALEILGIDVTMKTIVKETLTIIEKGLRQKYHPDKGGQSERFVLITKAVKVLTS
jgi:hypothetical protein